MPEKPRSNPEKMKQKNVTRNVDIEKKNDVKAKHPEVPAELSDDEKLMKKAELMVHEKLNDAVLHVKKELQLTKKPADPEEVKARLKKAGQDFMDNLSKDPDFPGIKYITKIMYSKKIRIGVDAVVLLSTAPYTVDNVHGTVRGREVFKMDAGYYDLKEEKDKPNS